MEFSLGQKIRRRNFIKIALLSIAGATLPSYFFWKSKQQWIFLERDVEILKASEFHIIKNFVPLHREFPVDPEHARNFQQMRKEVDQIILEQVNKKGLEEKINYEVNASRQFYGVPEESKYAQPLVKYCKKAQEFLYSSLSGLRSMVVDWQAVKKGQDYTKTYSGKGLIGKYMYEVTRIKAVNKKNPEANIYVTRIEPSVNSFYFKHRESGHSWVVFIVPGRLSLMAPFSELIPFSIAEVSERFEKKAGFEKADKARESISEGISHALAQKLAHQLDIPNGIKYINDNLERLASYETDSSPYRYVPNAFRWIQKNTAQKALDMYLESPERFVQLIQNY